MWRVSQASGMTLLLNVTDAASAAPNFGISRTERELARALIDRPDVEFVAIHGQRLWQVERSDVAAALKPPASSEQPRVERLGVDPPPAPTTGRRARIRRALATSGGATPAVTSIRLRRLRTQPGDVLLSAGLDWVHGLLGEAERLVFGTGVRYVGFCYDTIPADHPEWLFPPDPAGFLKHFTRVTRVADKVLCISASTRRDFIRLFPAFGDDRVHVLRIGADAAVDFGPAQDEFAASLFDGEPYAVYCATVDRRKNHELLYRALKELAGRGIRANIAFVGMLGNGVNDLFDALRHDRDVRGRVAHVTLCDDAHLAAIYRRATFAVYPSLYEGWGLGVTEALAHGKPCLIASGSSLGEAGLGVCRELHPLRTTEWADSIAEYFAAPPSVPGVELPTWRSTGEQLLGLVGA